MSHNCQVLTFSKKDQSILLVINKICDLLISWRVKFHKMRGINIGKNVYIGYDLIFDRIHPDCITNAHSRGSLPLRNKYPRSVHPVTIGSGVWMAPGCIVIQGVDIGEKSVIGTGAVVTKSMPANCLAAGVPAKVIKNLE